MNRQYPLVVKGLHWPKVLSYRWLVVLPTSLVIWVSFSSDLATFCFFLLSVSDIGGTFMYYIINLIPTGFFSKNSSASNCFLLSFFLSLLLLFVTVSITGKMWDIIIWHHFFFAMSFFSQTQHAMWCVIKASGYTSGDDALDDRETEVEMRKSTQERKHGTARVGWLDELLGTGTWKKKVC